MARIDYDVYARIGQRTWPEISTVV